MPAKRTITNKGFDPPQSLFGNDGSPLANAAITFMLVDAERVPAATFDKGTWSLIVAKEVVIRTDANGEFSVDLWPTSRGKDEVFYLCRVQRTYSFIGELTEGSEALSWADFANPARSGSTATYDDGTTVAYDDGSPVEQG